MHSRKFFKELRQGSKSKRQDLQRVKQFVRAEKEKYVKMETKLNSLLHLIVQLIMNYKIKISNKTSRYH